MFSAIPDSLFTDFVRKIRPISEQFAIRKFRTANQIELNLIKMDFARSSLKLNPKLRFTLKQRMWFLFALSLLNLTNGQFDGYSKTKGIDSTDPLCLDHRALNGAFP